jgi:hypothetical protein
MLTGSVSRRGTSSLSKDVPFQSRTVGDFIHDKEAVPFLAAKTFSTQVAQTLHSNEQEHAIRFSPCDGKGTGGAGSSGFPEEGAIKIVGSADEREMREPLGEIAQRFPVIADLLGIQAHVVGITEHLFEHQPGLVEP